MGVDTSIDHMGVVEVALRHRVRQPPIICLLTESEYPARDGDRVTLGGKIGHERVHHFGRVSRAKNAAARFKISTSCSNTRTRFLASRSSTASVELTPGFTPSSTSACFIQLCNVASEIPKSFAIWRNGASRYGLRQQRHDAALWGVALAFEHPSARTAVLTCKESTVGWADPNIRFARFVAANRGQ